MYLIAYTKKSQSEKTEPYTEEGMEHTNKNQNKKGQVWYFSRFVIFLLFFIKKIYSQGWKRQSNIR